MYWKTFDSDLVLVIGNRLKKIRKRKGKRKGKTNTPTGLQSLMEKNPLKATCLHTVLIFLTWVARRSRFNLLSFYFLCILFDKLCFLKTALHHVDCAGVSSVKCSILSVGSVVRTLVSFLNLATSLFFLDDHWTSYFV